MARHGENIRLRTDGRWEARALMEPRDQNRGKYKYFYGHSYQEVKQKRANYMKGSLAAGVSKGSQAGNSTADPAPCPTFDQTGNRTIEPPIGESIDLQTGQINDLAADQLIRPPAGQAPVPAVDQPAERAGSQPRAQPVTFKNAAERWLAARRPLVKASTYAHYAYQIEKHLLPELGEHVLSDFGSQMLEDFLMKKLESGGLAENGALSARTVSGLKTMIMQILKYAKSHEMMESLPECPCVPCVRPSIRTLSVQEQDTLVRQSMKEDTEFSLSVLLSLYAGLRIGEVCALQWSDFNFLCGTVTVQKTVMRIPDRSEKCTAKTRVFIDTPKTLCSERTIPLADDVAGYLSERQKKEEAYVLTGTEKFMEPRVCLDRYKRLLRRAGLPEYNFHLLRHTFATRCVERGVDFKSLSEFMGHSNVSITMQRYVHPSMELKKEQINKLDGLPVRGLNS